ncbi:MAG TPA: hypothetical protein VM345_06900 [Acidimicrobiales bacterium]|nr:hypothetical protein [Acidimicrobiales bacterium]
MRRALAAVALAVALIGGACGNDDNGGSASGDLPLLPGAGGGASRSALSAESGAAASGDSAAVASDMPIAPEPYQPIEYRLADDIDAMGGKAAAYRVDGGVDGDAVAKVAKAFGVSGKPKDENGYWAVGDVKGGGSWINVDRNGMFSYSNDAAQSAVASESVACAPDGTCERSDTVAPPPPPNDLPDDGDAERKARELFEAAGMSLRNTEVRVDRSDYAVSVVFTLEVDDIAVEGLGASMSFGDKGIVQYASGFLADTSKIGDYPLLETAPAYERWTKGMGDGVGIAVDGVARPEPATGAPEPAVDMPARGDTRPQSQPPSTLPPKTVDIDAVELVLMVEYGRCPGDPLYLVPAYRLSADGELWGVVPAVTDEYLASAQAPAGGDAGGDRGDSYEPCPNEGGGQTEPGREPEGGGTDGYPPVTI